LWLRDGIAARLTISDTAENLASAASIVTLTAEAFATEDLRYIRHALGFVARAKGTAKIAEQTGPSREQLYRSLSEHGNPTLKTMIAMMKVRRIKLTAKVPA
jgi:probable addiction module antidote protein